MRTAALTVAAVVVSLLAPSLAHATVHSGRIVFPEPQNPPSIGVPPPPAIQTRQHDHEVVIQYNASLGSVTFSAEVWDTGHVESTGTSLTCLLLVGSPD
jgi:hypothetical protein